MPFDWFQQKRQPEPPSKNHNLFVFVVWAIKTVRNWQNKAIWFLIAPPYMEWIRYWPKVAIRMIALFRQFRTGLITQTKKKTVVVFCWSELSLGSLLPGTAGVLFSLNSPCFRRKRIKSARIGQRATKDQFRFLWKGMLSIAANTSTSRKCFKRSISKTSQQLVSWISAQLLSTGRTLRHSDEPR